jgi:hypothetical protein
VRFKNSYEEQVGQSYDLNFWARKAPHETLGQNEHEMCCTKYQVKCRKIFSVQFSSNIIFQKDSYDQPRAEKYEDNEQPVQRKAPEELSASTKNVPLKSENPESRLFLFQILDLVDRYWNGSKSLHKNNKFKGMVAFIHCFIYRSLKFLPIYHERFNSQVGTMYSYTEK